MWYFSVDSCNIREFVFDTHLKTPTREVTFKPNN